jgi:hypothetical protein
MILPHGLAGLLFREVPGPDGEFARAGIAAAIFPNVLRSHLK